jgi:hypothetical protein
MLFLEEDHLVADDFLDALDGLTGLITQNTRSSSGQAADAGDEEVEEGAAGVRFVSLDDGRGHEEAVSITHRDTLRESGSQAGDGGAALIESAEVRERWGGNLGYGWNRSSWRLIRAETAAFCDGRERKTLTLLLPSSSSTA